MPTISPITAQSRNPTTRRLGTWRHPARTHAIGGLLALGLLLPGCRQELPRTSAGHPLPENPLVADCAPGRCGGELHLALPGNPRNFNPFTNDPVSQEITRMLFASLVRMDWQTQEVRPALAEKWQVEPDGKTWTFKLRRGLRWSDGQPLNADDVVFTWNDVIYARKGVAFLAEIFSIGGTNFSVSKVDDLTVRVVTPDVFAPFVEFLGNVPVLPRHTFLQQVADKNSPAPEKYVVPIDQIACSGPFRIKRFNPDSSLVLERNPEYWVVDKAGQRLPYFDYIIVSILPSPGLDKAAFLKGQLDACEKVSLDDYDSFSHAGGRIQLLDAGLAVEKDILWFNQNTNRNPLTGRPLVAPAKLKWFRDQRFRQAVALAIDRDRIAREVYRGHAEPAYGFLGAENRKWNNPDVPRAACDPARARALLAELGFKDTNGDGVLEDPDGNAAEIVFNTNLGNASRIATAGLIAEDLAKVGIKLNVQTLPFQLIATKVGESLDYECVLLGLGGGGIDPTSTINALRSDSCQWFPAQPAPSTEWEARIDSLMAGQLHTQDFAARKKFFDEVQRILAEQLPMIYTVTPHAYCAVGKDIGNARPATATPYRATWNIEELYRK